MALYSVEVTEHAKDHFRGHIGYIINKLRNPDAAWHLRDALDQEIHCANRKIVFTLVYRHWTKV